MKKILFAMVASLATLVATSAGAQAAFAVSFTIDGVSQSLVPSTNQGNSPGSNVNGATFVDSQTFTVGAGTVTLSLATVATEVTGSFSRLNTGSANVSNDSGASHDFVITITQNAFIFPGPFATFTSPVTARVFGAITSGTATATAKNLGTYTNIIANSGGNQTFTNTGLSGSSGAAPGFITQTITFNGLTTTSATTYAGDSIVTSLTPLPATALMAGLAFPLLGLAGAARRRLFA